MKEPMDTTVDVLPARVPAIRSGLLMHTSVFISRGERNRLCARARLFKEQRMKADQNLSLARSHS